MQGKTHLAVGTAAALAIMQPDNLSELLLGTAIAAVGTIMSDIDVESSKIRKGIKKVLTAGVCVAGILFFVEKIWHIGIAAYLLSRHNDESIMMATIALIFICIYGKNKPHRSFMHSFLALLLLYETLSVLIPSMVRYFAIGFLSHLALDMFNKKGMQLFFPVKKRFSLGLCPADGKADEVLCKIGIVALILIGAVLIIRIASFYI